MAKALGTIFTIILLCVFLIFTFSHDYVLKREIYPNVFEYYTYNTLEPEDQNVYYQYLDSSKRTYRAYFVYDSGINDLMIHIDYVFDYTRLPNDIIINGYITPVAFEQDNGQYGFSNPLAISINSKDLFFGINNELLGIDGYTTIINAQNCLSVFSMTGEYFLEYMGGFAPDFGNVDGFLDGVMAGVRVLIFPLVSIIALVKSVGIFFAFYGGGFFL